VTTRRSEVGGALCGLVAPVVFLLLYGIAVALDPAYDFYEDYLSDLGVGPGAWAFNSAVIAAGALIVLFAAFGLGSALGWKNILGGLGCGLLSASGVALIGVGLFPEDYGRLHTAVSVAFFLLLYAALVVLVLPVWKTNVAGRAGAAATSGAALLGLLLIPFGGSPETETVAVLAAVAWGIIASVGRLILLRRGRAAAP